ncbi:transglutaminase family protein [Ideonella paludis]|uniref:Transglutaminase family protein n=1 Tax=Ideonella paludis TaxID=1233411 RepID=A0ABS5DST3_9BURK|nr:transglutaminase family protein [Ideonella paludis]MBQ0934208.1 transglutaminase family protein [Ideonella paludis]
MSSNTAPRVLHVRHVTTYRHSQVVDLAQHVAYLLPRTRTQQTLLSQRLRISPTPDHWAEDGPPPPQALSLDRLGNQRLVFAHSRPHNVLEVRSDFSVALAPAPPPDLAAGPPWPQVADELRYHAGPQAPDLVLCSVPSRYTPLTPELRAFAHAQCAPQHSAALAAWALCCHIHDEFAYRPHSTDVNTRAPDVLRLRAGVCQDFAHLMIAACRALGLPARYVSGYLLTQPPPGRPRLIGADASHAWVEVWCPPHGWLAFDPTNRCLPADDHVQLALGRDFADVAPLRGVIRGSAGAQMTVSVTVSPQEIEG